MSINERIREEILDLTADKSYNACSAEELTAMLRTRIGDTEIPENEDFAAACTETITAMCDTKELGKSGRGNIVCGAQLGYVTGTFRANAKGFGFLTPDARYAYLYEEDLFIGRDNTGGAMNGDTVMVRVTEPKRDSRGRTGASERGGHRTEASVIRVITRALTHVVGTLYVEPPRTRKGASRYYVEPDNTKIATIVNIPAKDLGEAEPGDKVETEIIKYPKPDYPDALGRVTYVFGDAQSRAANYEVILRENRIRGAFAPEVEEAAEAEASRPLSAEGRLDLRDKIVFTIDSAEAKDLDDAVSLEKTENGWLLGVHIADVSEYVRAGSVLDEEAFLRGTSVYFADKVVPMLPRALSNGSCSLNGGEDHYALSALITLDAGGNIVGCDLKETLIHSKVRGVYAELNDILEKGEASPYYEKYSILFPDVYPEMVRLYEILDKKNRAKGALELETTEPKFILDENGLPVDIIRRERGISECMIEQFMLCANEAVASWLYEMHMPCVYRVHEEPPADKIQTFSEFAYNLGLDIRSLKRKQLRPIDMQAVMNEAKEKGLDRILSTVMLRSLSKAKYSGTQGIHFGLATEFYCHFTSPIRRYPDLSVHRIVKTVLRGQMNDAAVKKSEAFAERSAVQSTECEIRALTAERAIEDLYKVLYMQSRVGAVYDGVISSVTSFGFFVELDNTCEGLVPITSLNGYFTFNEKNLSLSCGRTQYKLGQQVRVSVVKADLITRRIDMELEEEPLQNGEKRYAETRPSRRR
ncbi:MAG: ribonuclease R [Eubacteriales bacterium]